MWSKCPSPGEAPGRAAVCLLSVRATVSTNSGQLAGPIFRAEPGAAPQPPLETGPLCHVYGKRVRKQWLGLLSSWDFQIKSETNPSSNTNLARVGLERSPLRL